MPDRNSRGTGNTIPAPPKSAASWKDRILSFARKYGKPAAFVAKLALQTFIPGGSALVDWAKKLFQSGEEFVESMAEDELLKTLQATSADMQHLAEVLSVLQEEMGELLSKVSALEGEPDRAKELLALARSTDKNTQRVLVRLKRITSRFDHVEQQNDRILQGQEEILFFVKEMAAEICIPGTTQKDTLPKTIPVSAKANLHPSNLLPPSALTTIDSREVARREQKRWLQRLDCEGTWTNEAGIRFRLIPPGRFRFGAAPGDTLASADEKPPQTYSIDKPLWVATCPLTNAAVQYFLQNASGEDGSDVAQLLTDRAFAYRCRRGEAEDFPVVEINALDALVLCRWLKQRDGRRYRLPTEVEWEYFARGGACGLYWWEEGLPAHQRAVFAAKGLAPVDERRANGWVICDPLGNVAEWTASEYGPLDSGLALKIAPRLNSTLTVRGGSWRDPLEQLRLSRRLSMNGTSRKDWLGVRLVCDIEAS